MTSGCSVSCGTFWIRNTPEGQLEREQRRAGVLSLAFERQRDLEVGRGELLHPDVDLDVDCRLRLGRLQRAWRIRILERKILDVLGEHGELRLPLLSLARLRGRALRRAAIAGSRHHSYLS